MMIILFTRSLPNAISDELSRQGHTVHEALAISEVLALAEQHPEAQIVIAADVEPARVNVIEQHHPTMQLTADTTAADVIFQLSHLAGETRVQ